MVGKSPWGPGKGPQKMFENCRRHHGRFATHTLSYTFFKNQIFKIFLGPFPEPWGLLPTTFEFHYSRYISSNFSDVSTSILASFFTVLPKGLTAQSYVHVALYQGVPNLWAVAIPGPYSSILTPGSGGA